MMEFLAGFGIGLWIGAVCTILAVIWLKAQGFDLTRRRGL